MIVRGTPYRRIACVSCMRGLYTFQAYCGYRKRDACNASVRRAMRDAGRGAGAVCAWHVVQAHCIWRKKCLITPFQGI